MTMATVEEECWHGKLSSKEAEERLVAVNKINAYLFRESEVKRNKFILSYISDKTRGLFKHLIVPAPSRKRFSSVNDAFSVMDRMAVSSDHCSNPVPPSIVNRDNSDMSEDDEPLSDLACHVCETVCESIFSYTLLLNARIATNSCQGGILTDTLPTNMLRSPPPRVPSRGRATNVTPVLLSVTSPTLSVVISKPVISTLPNIRELSPCCLRRHW